MWGFRLPALVAASQGTRRSAGKVAAVLLAVASVVASDPPAAASPREPVATAAAACSTVTFETSRFVVCRYEPQRDALRIVWRDATGPIGGFARLERSLGSSASRVRFAMNAGMFDSARAPVGLLVQAGQATHTADTGRGEGNYYLSPNGVFWTDVRGAAHVTETNRFLALAPAPIWATQSGPLLLEGGRLHPAVAADGPSRKIRNAVGACGGGLAAFVISTDPVSFGRLARLFQTRLDCQDALYLDGVVSSIWAPAMKRRDPRTGLGPLVVVSEKAR